MHREMVIEKLYGLILIGSSKLPVVKAMEKIFSKKVFGGVTIIAGGNRMVA
jgi:hypothetical protein